MVPRVGPRELVLTTKEALLLYRRGWAYYEHAEEAPEGLLLRLARRDGRLRVVEVRTPRRHALTAGMLRALPVARIEAAANDPDPVAAIQIEQVIREGPPIDPSKPYASLPSDSFFRDPRRVARRRRTIRQLRLRVPQGSRKPDDFYERVAQAYVTEVSRGSRGPAAAIAEANGVPVTTVHRWVKEARRRGLLGKPGQGRAG
jgi:transposase-like protein